MANPGGGATSGSYYEEYMRSNALLKHGHDKNAKKLLTDRNAYISFLEVQLERVSAACLTTQSFDKRLRELESTQSEQDQKLGSLSKVCRLSQEYMEQSAEQTRTDVNGLETKWAAWMDKHSHEFAAQQMRTKATHEQLRSCEDFVQRLANQSQSEVGAVRASTEQELEDVRTLVDALAARIENIQTANVDTNAHVAFLKDLVTDRFDKELAIVRTSVSEKCFTMESKLQQLTDTLERLPNQLETSWRADVVRLESTRDDAVRDLHDRVAHTSEQQAHDRDELTHVLRKCLDTQHLLSAAVVALQRDVDDNSTDAQQQQQHETNVRDVQALSSTIDDVRENQRALTDALRVLQQCAQSAQLESQEHVTALATRLETAEETFARLADDALTQADDLRTKMLVALGEVEQKLRHDADVVADQAVHSVRVESESQFKQMLAFTTAVENRLRILERSVTSLKASAHRSCIVSNVRSDDSLHSHAALDDPVGNRDDLQCDDARATTHHRPSDQSRQSSAIAAALLASHQDVEAAARRRLEDAQREAVLQRKIRALEDRLERQRESEDERQAVFARQSTTRARASGSASVSSSPSSLSSSSCETPRLRRPLPTAPSDSRRAATLSKSTTIAPKAMKDRKDKATVAAASMKKKVGAKEDMRAAPSSTRATAITAGASGRSKSVAKSKALREVR